MSGAWDWQAHAACRGEDLNLFFGCESEQYNKDAKKRREAEARAVCASCPVQPECLDYATYRPERAGVWGGTNEDERAARRRRESRARLTAQRRAGAAA